ncbi:MAG TPA: hypothetical protein VF228_01845 [Iamia sp.]
MSPVHRRRPLALLIPALTLAVLAVAGCSKSAGPSQEQYVAVADDVCASTEKRLEELQEAHDADLYEAAATGESGIYVDRPDRWVRAKVVPAYQGMSNGLKGIQPPDGDTAYLTDLYADLDEHIESIHLNPSAEEGKALRTPDTRLTDRFASYGMEVCGTF